MIQLAQNEYGLVTKAKFKIEIDGNGESRLYAPPLVRLRERTPRGSMTARERYGADLYQTGGSPSSDHG